jgi:uncharacterized protein involved in copper resistance
MMRAFWTALLWLEVSHLAVAEPSAPLHAERVLAYVQAEQSEFRFAQGGADTYSWDVRGWIGGDYDRLWFKTQGDDLLDGPVETAELQLRYSRLFTAFWELAVGVRYDLEPEPARGFAVFAAHGLAPFLYEVDADAFISEDGDVSARIEVEYPILITQRLILQPALELDFVQNLNAAPESVILQGLPRVAVAMWPQMWTYTCCVTLPFQGCVPLV